MIEQLALLNTIYEEKFGFIFLVCASGKEPAFFVSEIERRIEHDREEELGVAAVEQGKITNLRLSKLLLELPN